MQNFRYADIHCHPNLKTFGHSFDKTPGSSADMWYRKPHSLLTRNLHRITGITKFSQTSFTSMSLAGAKVISLSLYPFEKGFFINPNVSPLVAAFLADWGIEIGYRRVRHLQQHTDYFSDLLKEYNFVLGCRKRENINGKPYAFEIARNGSDLEVITAKENTIAVVLSIEGAHVFNCGLEAFGVPLNEEEVLSNISKVKAWPYAPLFIGLAHNFNNGLCGHARSLQRLGKLVDQSMNLDKGIFGIGYKVIQALLDDRNGRPVYIDLKHMSGLSRKQYLDLLSTDYRHRKIPVIVSHGSVTGTAYDGTNDIGNCYAIFNPNDINFFDEEILAIARSGGLFGIQMDIGNNADLAKLNLLMPRKKGEGTLPYSARIIWNQLQYIAQLLDRNGLNAWNVACIGSDFDGSINPFPGILTVESFEPLADELLLMADAFLETASFVLKENRSITPEEIIDRFFYSNAANFMIGHY